MQHEVSGGQYFFPIRPFRQGLDIKIFIKSLGAFPTVQIGVDRPELGITGKIKFVGSSAFDPVIKAESHHLYGKKKSVLGGRGRKLQEEVKTGKGTVDLA